MNEREERKDGSYRLGLFALFLLCGLAIFLPPIFLEGDIQIIYLIAIPLLFLLSTVPLYGNKRLEKYFQVFFAFFVMSFVLFLQHIVVVPGWSSSTIDGIVFSTLLSTLLVVLPIILLTKISGNDMASIYVKRGKLRSGLIVGLATFLIFLVTSVQGAQMLFAGQNITFELVSRWSPWILAFVLSNGLREELWFRGLFLKKFESLIGARTSNFLVAIIFSLAHIGVQYTPVLLIFLAIVFFLGLAFGFVMQKTDSLLGPALFHAGVDIPTVLGIFSNL